MPILWLDSVCLAYRTDDKNARPGALGNSPAASATGYLLWLFYYSAVKAAVCPVQATTGRRKHWLAYYLFTGGVTGVDPV